MNVQQYIESGVLESYALGMLTTEEQKEVEENAAQYPAIKQALRENRETLSEFSRAYSVTPPPHLRQQVLNAALQQDRDAVEKPRQKSVSRGKPWAIAATLLFLISGGFNFYQYQNTRETQKDLIRTQLKLAELESENQVMVARYQSLHNQFAVLLDPATTQFVMKAVEGRDAQYRADIFWNSESEMVFLDLKDLPPPPRGKDYQLWALKDGKPIDMGVFSTSAEASELRKIGQVPEADAFAVTLEPAGGSKNPTLEEMMVYGEPAGV